MMVAPETTRADGIERYIAPFAVSAVAVVGAAYSALRNPFAETLFPRCVLLETTGFACPACGATRATHLLFQGDIAGAFDFNALLVIALPLLLFALARWWIGAARRWPSTWTTARAVGVFVVLLAWGVVRNLPFEPFAALNL